MQIINKSAVEANKKLLRSLPKLKIACEISENWFISTFGIFGTRN